MNNQNIWIYNPKLKQWYMGYIIDINDNIFTVPVAGLLKASL